MFPVEVSVASVARLSDTCATVTPAANAPVATLTVFAFAV